MNGRGDISAPEELEFTTEEHTHINNLEDRYRWFADYETLETTIQILKTKNIKNEVIHKYLDL